MPAALDALVALLAGWAQAQAFAPREGWALQVLATAVLAWRVMRAPTVRRATLLGWCFGLAWLAGAVWWLFISMHRYGGLPAWLSALAVAALSAALALYLALAMAAFARWRSGRPGADALLFAACWLLAELARGLLFTGFPWVASGYAHSDGPLAALAPWVGVYGMGFVAAWLAAAAAAGLARAGRARHAWLAAGGAPLALVLAAAMAPSDFTRPAGRFDVTLLQPNVAQDEKFSAEHLPAALEWLGRELVSARTALVVAPETAIPLLPAQQPEGYWDALAAHFARGPGAALIGVPLGDFTEGYTNSVAGLAPGQPMYRYDKIHLVPFGEFVPRGFRWFVDMMDMPLGDFTRGRDARPFEFDGQRIRPTICYEDLFGEELAANFVGPGQATVIANVSNIGWFGPTEAVDQHLQISRLRALEFQRPLVRATNTGATAIIDHRGRVTHGLAPHTRGVLVGEVEGREGSTPYARWVATLGLWPWTVLAGGVLLLAARRRKSGVGA